MTMMAATLSSFAQQAGMSLDEMMSFFFGSCPRRFHQSMAISPPVMGSPESTRTPVHCVTQSGARSRKPREP